MNRYSKRTSLILVATILGCQIGNVQVINAAQRNNVDSAQIDLIQTQSLYTTTGGGVVIEPDVELVSDTSWYSEETKQLKEYTIKTASELAGIAELVNDGIESFQGWKIYLGSNIDLNNQLWTPIGGWNGKESDATRYFAGVFDGCGYSISNINIEGYEYSGIFGYAVGEIKNLTVLDGLIESKSSLVSAYAGGIVGYSRSVITNCNAYNMEIVTSTNIDSMDAYAGGISGWAYEINDCKSTSTVKAEVTYTSATAYAGGISGFANNGRRNFNEGNISSIATSSSDAYAGGVFGMCDSVSDSSNLGSVKASNSTNSYVGGISGVAYSVTNCDNSGDIYSATKYNYAETYGGGIVGNNTGMVEECTNSGKIEVYSTSSHTRAGGISGYSNGQISYCHNNGDVKSTSINYGSYAGGITSSSYYGSSISNCYNTGNIVADENGKYSVGSAGGIVGIMFDSGSSGRCTVRQCYNEGNVDITSSNYFVEAGGIAGRGNGTIIDCYNIGKVSAGLIGNETVSNDVDVAGIATGSEVVIQNCYNAGSVWADAKDSSVGGIIQEREYGSSNNVVENSYMLDIACSLGKGKVLNSTEMKIKDNFKGFNFESIWSMDAEVNGGYPYLSWMVPEGRPDDTPNLSFIRFRDINFKKALIDESVDKNNDGEITIKEMEDITELWIDNKQIKDISEIRYAKNLKRLYMDGNEISDISMLVELPSLQVLGVSANKITDISVLSQITTLIDINLSYNSIKNIDVFENMPWIKSLGLYTCDIQDISVLRQLPELEELFIGNNPIIEIEVIGELDTLKMLSLPNSKIKDISFISKLVNLEWLNLDNNYIDNLEFLPINSYEYLNLANNYLDISENSPTTQIIEQIKSMGREIIYSPQKIIISDNANLSSLEVNHGTLYPVFDKDILNYTVDVQNSVNTIMIIANLEDIEGSVEGTGEKTLEVGKNTISITVTSKDGKTTKVYTIVVNRASDSSSGGSGGSSGGSGGSSGGSGGSSGGSGGSSGGSGGSSGGSGGGGFIKPSTTEQVIEKLPEEDKEIIINNFKENMPYTSLNTDLTLEQLKELTNNKFTDEQLQEMLDDMELLQSLGVDKSMLSSQVLLAPIEDAIFTDVSETHWANDAIKLAAQLGLVAGMPDGTFAPSASLQVADTFTFLDRLLLLNNISQMKLPRSTVEKYITDKEHWAFISVASVGSKLTEETLKVISELGEKPITRGLLAQVLYEITDGNLEEIKEGVNFEDTLDSPYKEGIDYCVRTGLLQGVSETTMLPDKALTRAEIMTVLIRLDEYLK